MVRIGVMRVTVGQRLVPVPVRMSRSLGDRSIVRVQVM